MEENITAAARLDYCFRRTGVSGNDNDAIGRLNPVTKGMLPSPVRYREGFDCQIGVSVYDAGLYFLSFGRRDPLREALVGWHPT